MGRKKNKLMNNKAREVNRAVITNAEDFKTSTDTEMRELLKMENGLSQALGLPEAQTEGAQLSQTDTLFKNNRWYLISNMRQLLSQIYTEIGLVGTVVDIPVEDAFRGGIEIKTKQLDEDQIQKLETIMEEEDDLQKIAQANKWNRLYGGAGIVVITGDDPKSELNLDSIDDSSTVEFRAVDMWELFHSKQNTEDYSQDIDALSSSVEYYDYYGMQLHHSRVFILKGREAPSFIRPRLRGWGLSVIETLVRSINQYLKTTDLTFEVLDEFKLDIFKIKGLTSALYTKEGHAAIQKRVALAAAQKNYQNAITMDGEDDYVQKQLSFAGLSETMAGIRMQVASDVRMPLTKLFGISAAGFSSGEDDIENYNASIESGVRSKAKPMVLNVIKIRCMQLFGMVPDDLTIKFKPLRMLSSEQEENVKDRKFNRIMQAKAAGELTREEFRDMVNRDQLLPIQMEKEEIGELDKQDKEKSEYEKEVDKGVATTPTSKSTTQAPETKS